MFKDKNFGLPKDLIESARSVMEKKDLIADKMKELDKGKSGWETRGVSANSGKGFLKIPEYTANITDEGPAKREKFDLEKYKKETEAIKRSPGRFSPNIKLSENHVVKFTSYLKENFHINELTEEEIAWIYENEYVQWSEETAVDIRRQVRRNPSQQPDVLTRLGRGISDIASRAYDALPNVSDAAKLDNSWRQREKEDAEEGREAARREASKALQVASERDDRNTGPTRASGASKTSTPGASAIRKTDSDSSDPSRFRNFTSYRREGLGLGGDLKSAQSEPYKRAYREYRKAKTPERPFSITAYEPGGVFDRD